MLRVGEGRAEGLQKPPLLGRDVWEQMVRLVTQSGCQMLSVKSPGDCGAFFPLSTGVAYVCQCEQGGL